MIITILVLLVTVVMFVIGKIRADIVALCSLTILILSSKTIYENDWKRHPQRVLISLLFPIWHTAIVSVIHYHGVHTLSLLLSSTSLVSLCRCPTPYRVSANL